MGTSKEMIMRKPNLVDRGESQNQGQISSPRCSPISLASEKPRMIVVNKFLGPAPDQFNYNHQGGAENLCF
jgi:hypothetical protein